MNRQGIPPNFISLKWKTLGLCAILLAAIFFAFAVNQKFHLEQQLISIRSEVVDVWPSQIASLIKQYTDQLQSGLNPIISQPKVIRAIKKEHFKTVSDYLNSLWLELQLKHQFISMALLSNYGETLIEKGQPIIVQPLLEDTQVRGIAHTYIACNNQCSLFILIPLKADHQGTPPLVWVLGASLAPILEQFKALVQSDVALIAPQFLHPAAEASMNRRIATDDGIFDLLESYFPKYDLDAEQSWNPKLTKLSGRTYELFIRHLNHQVIGSPPTLFFATDVTHLLDSQKEYLTKLRMMAAIGFLLCMLFLWIAISEPINRLKQIAILIPNIGQDESPWRVRGELRLMQRISGWLDESDIISNASIELSDRLEQSQSRLRYRSHLVEQRKKQLLDEKALSEALINTAQVLVMILDKDLNIKRINQFGSRLIGKTREDIEQSSVSIMLAHAQDGPEIVEQLKRMTIGHLDHFQHQSEFIGSRGDHKYIAWFHAKVHDSSPEYCISTVGFDVSDRKRIEEHLTWLADRDPLTTLINRRRLLEELERAVNLCRRFHHHCALIIIDLDRFRDLNDSRGHLIGDEILKKVAHLIVSKCRDTELLARIGGDQFAVMLEESNIDNARHLAERLKIALCDSSLVDSEPGLKITASLGIAIYPEHCDNSRELLAHADLATYKAKEKGRNRVCVYDHLDQTPKKIKERVFWNDLVQHALQTDIIQMMYQPIQNIEHQKISHFEALLRVKNENGELLPPLPLVQAAERNHLIYQLDLKIIDIVFSDLVLLLDKKPDIVFSINLSGLSFQNDELLIKVRQLLSSHRISPHNIIFEITETAAVTDVQASVRIMREFKNLGLKLALDDFGVGFSSIYYLKQFPIDYLKIDGSFIQHLTSDENNQVLVKAAIEVAQAFRLETIAEFVEDDETLQLLKKMGTDFAQGYGIGKPETLENIQKMWL